MATQEQSPFVWGAAGAMLTPEEVARRREAADAMLAQGADYSPIGHWTQGLARVAKAIRGGLERRDADQAASEGRAQASEAYSKIAQALSGGGQAPTADVVAASESPWLSAGQRGVVGALLKQKMDAMKPPEPFTLSPGSVRYGADGKPIASVPARGAGEGPRRSLQPIYGVDEQGNPVVMQPGDDGTVARSVMPQGVTVSNKPLQMDAGTHFVLIDPVTRQQIGQVPKNVAGAAQQKAIGTASGEAQAQLPGAEGMASQIGKHIDELANDPYLPNMLGPLASRMPNVSADAARVQARMDQLKGGVFLQGYQMLKGGGAITEVEGLKAENAMARLSAAQNLQDYRAALGDFRDALSTGLAKLRSQAGMVPGGQQPGTGGAPPSRSAPQPGAVVNGFVYRGGNPKDPNSWGRAQ